ncbi:MAG: hypothetical protein GEV12_13390 [Micromonosporaceae bacterium]|nr:hypothetical protein [Micromonosporaceae bacterium]
MTGLAGGGGVRGLVRRVQRRVRLRTRLRRAGGAIRRAVPRRLPAWSEPAPGATTTPRPGEVDVTVGSPGALRRLPAATEPELTARTLRVEVSDWRTPYPGWSGRPGPLPGLVHQEVSLPPGGRGRATVSVTLAEPVPVPRILAAVRPALEPVHPAGAGTAAGGRMVTVDATAANPRGRDRYGSRLPAGRLTLAVDAGRVRWDVARRPDGVVVVAGWAGEPLDEPQRATLAGLGAVSYQDRAGPPPTAVAQVLAQLAMTGVVLHAPDPPDLLAPELAARLREPLPDRAADPLSWEVRSVRQRRSAIRHHAEGLARPPAVSALLVTKRPHLLAAAVAAMTAQTYPELEVVVGLHGGELPAGTRLTGPLVQIPAERNLGEALAEATRAASGDLVTKVDDDDRYGPEHIWDVVAAWHYSGATVAGKGADFVYLEPKDVTVRRRMGAEFYTDTVAGGTVTVARADLAAAGGWPPVPRWVDRALLDQVLAGGGLVYRTHPLGFVYTRHGDGHTWEADLEHFLVDPQRRWDGLPSDQEIGAA